MAINISSAWSILIIVMNRWLVMHIWSMIIHTCMISHMFLAMKNLARVWNCPKFTILNLVFVFLSFCLLFKDKKEKRKTIPLCRFLFLCFCIFVLFLSFCLCVVKTFFVFVFFPGHHGDQMSEGPQFWKVTLCVEILKLWKAADHLWSNT